MHLRKRQIVQPDAGCHQRALPGHGAAFELENVAARHRQKVLHVLGGAEHDRLLHFQRRIHVSQHQRRRTVGYQRAVGALERSCDARILLAFGAAELIAEILAHLRIRVGDAIFVVLGGDQRERVRLVAPALEIRVGDFAEHAGEAALDAGLLAYVRCLEQVAADLGRRRRRHLLDADHQNDARRFCRDRLQSLVHGGRTGRAGILHPRRALEAQIGRRLQYQRRGKILRRKAGVEVAEHDFVHIARLDAGVRQRFARHLDDQAFDGLAAELAERRMCPTHDAGGHAGSLFSPGRPVANFGRFYVWLCRNV